MNVALAVGAVTVLVLGLASGFIKNRLWVSEPLIALLIGIALGPAVIDAAAFTLPEEQQPTVLLEFARITLAISIMGAALRLPARWESVHWRELTVVLIVGMPLMWLVGSGLALAMLGLPVLYALLVGAILSPTDPVLADSIVTGEAAEKFVPVRMRNTITAESGANDGLALLIVMLPVYLLDARSGVGGWIEAVLLHRALGGIAAGVAIGWLSCQAFKWVIAKEQTERPSILTLSLSLALAVLGIDLLLKTDSLLAVFAAGVVFNRGTHAHEEGLHENMQSAVARFFDIPIFIFLGTLLPWQGWLDLGWQGLGFALAVLLLRRLPAWLMMRPLLSSVQGWRETAFTGWFGPIGIAAVFYAMEMQKEPAIEHPDRIWHVVSLVVFCSIVLHGISATPLTRAFGRSGAAHPNEAPDGAVGIGWDAAGRRSAGARKSPAGPDPAGATGGPDAGQPADARRAGADRGG